MCLGVAGVVTGEAGGERRSPWSPQAVMLAGRGGRRALPTCVVETGEEAV